MTKRTSLEIRKIFGFSRDDINRLEKSKVIKPQKNGQGIASEYSEKDLERLLDVKLYLLGGLRISDMEDLFKNKIDSGRTISEHIHLYKKRIQMLEFIELMRAEIRKFKETNRVRETKTVTLTNPNTKKNEIDTYEDQVWDALGLFFDLSFLCRGESRSEENLKEDKKRTLKRTLEAYEKLEHFIDKLGIEINSKMLRECLIEMASEPFGDDSEIKEAVMEWVEEYRKNKTNILDQIEKKGIEPAANGLDGAIQEQYKSILRNIISFFLDYFIDEEELFYLLVNVRYFLDHLDKETLIKGKVMIQ